MTHEQKPESAEFRTRERQISSLAFHLHEATCDICWSVAATMAEKEIVEAEARGAAEQRRKDAEKSKAKLFCEREKDATDRTPQREDVKQWQTDQKEFFLASMIEVVTEYAEWRDRKDAEGTEPVGYISEAALEYLTSPSRLTQAHIYGSANPTWPMPLYSRPASVAALEARVKELEGTLRNVRAAIELADPKVLVCTLWMRGPPETVVDYISAAIREGGDHV